MSDGYEILVPWIVILEILLEPEAEWYFLKLFDLVVLFILVCILQAALLVTVSTILLINRN